MAEGGSGRGRSVCVSDGVDDGDGRASGGDDGSATAPLIAARVGRIPPNPFAAADARVAAAIAGGLDVIDLSKGNPDGEPPRFMVDAAVGATRDPANFRYPAFDGKPAFLDAVAGWYGREHGVRLDPATQILAVSGASVGISVTIEALIDDGDLVVLVGPYYPQYEGSTAVAGGRIHVVPTDADHDFLPDLDAVPAAVWDEAKLLILNYPNNPTGAAATRELFATAVRIAHRHHLVVVNDFAYAGIGFDETPPLSLLSVPGSEDVAVELCSLSKMYMVAGWRGGFVVGEPTVMKAIKAVHRQTSLLVTTTVQDAGAAGLNSDQSTVRVLARRYRHRYETLRDGLSAAGLHLETARGGLFAWMRAPDGWSDAEFSDWLLHKAQVAVIPGSDFGPTGAGHVRLSLLVPSAVLAKASERIAAARGEAW